MDRYVLNTKAFSLVEMAIALAVMVVVVVIVLPLGGQVVQKARDIKSVDDLNAVAQASLQCYRSSGHWPNQFSDLQPDLLSNGINGSNYIFNPQTNILTIVSNQKSVSVPRPRGLTARLDYI